MLPDMHVIFNVQSINIIGNYREKFVIDPLLKAGLVAGQVKYQHRRNLKEKRSLELKKDADGEDATQNLHSHGFP